MGSQCLNLKTAIYIGDYLSKQEVGRVTPDLTAKTKLFCFDFVTEQITYICQSMYVYCLQTMMIYN